MIEVEIPGREPVKIDRPVRLMCSRCGVESDLVYRYNNRDGKIHMYCPNLGCGAEKGVYDPKPKRERKIK